MPISIFRLRTTPCLPLTPTYLRRIPALRFIITARQHNPSNVSRKPQQPTKNLLKARDTVKQFSNLASALSPDDELHLSHHQAVGMVAAAQANFMRVIVQSPPPEAEASIVPAAEGSEDDQRGGIEIELLCVVKAVLKKIKRRVLVGDRVLVGSIDWVDKRGMIENVFQRKSQVLDPPVANVDQLLVLFSMDQPKIEPFALTRFLVEAESTGIPLTLALNKAELADEEIFSLSSSTVKEKPTHREGRVVLVDLEKGDSMILRIIGASKRGDQSTDDPTNPLLSKAHCRRVLKQPS